MVAKITSMKADIQLKTEKISWKGRVWKWALHWSYNGVGTAILQGRITHQWGRQFDKPMENNSVVLLRREEPKWIPLLQNNAFYGLHEGRDNYETHKKIQHKKIQQKQFVLLCLFTLAPPTGFFHI